MSQRREAKKPSFTDKRQYVLHTKIAEGGMGAIYRAHQQGVEQFSKDVAVKVIRTVLSENEEFRRLFVGEAKLVADLVHENIVQVYHLGEISGQYFIAIKQWCNSQLVR